MAEGPPPGTAAPQPAHRLFFALWPDEGMREAMTEAIRAAAHASGGRPVPPSNLHVTMAFLGSVPEGRLGQLAAIARCAEGPRSGGGASLASEESGVELIFSRLEYWRAAHLLCAVPDQAPARVTALARGLQERLSESGFAPDLKGPGSVGLNITRPFRPHVTVARKVYRSPRIEMQPVTWSFTDLVLVDSKTLPEGSVYTVLERFPLGH
ncbi:MAG TPA: RNA 2',3'-cyclic phosphodiesterase [Steroidobacteraceae bacterium]|nr:RNA 2',3'-cyclic phosphodiesterase [Steroidobacteraceae bacterium]